MKKSIYLIATLCVVVFSSCSNDGDSSSESVQGQTAKIELTLTGSTTTRTVSSTNPVTGVATAEGTVNNIVVGIFNASDEVLTVQSITSPGVGSGDANKNTITCPLTGTATVTCSAVVVANVPDATVTALKSTTTKALFLAEAISLEDATASGDDQVSTNLPMSGGVIDSNNSDAETFTLTPGGTTTGLSVEVVRMVSRITLTSLSADFTSSSYPDATFKLQRVFLRDAIAATKVTTSATSGDAMSGTSYLTGGGTWSSDTWSGDNAFLYDALSAELLIESSTTLPGSKYYWFYAFANDGSTSPTAFVIQGSFDQDGDGTSYSSETVFYPVIVNKMQPGTTIGGTSYSGTTTTGSISRNQLYNLSVTLKNKGVSSPTDNINPANLEISVTVADWPTAIEQVVTFD
ncbi:MAG: Major fimbrial subunit protein (FimA) [Bacteroidetes bacterium]|nr:Major fimbrial subunit protein (FimA) [Bacteroidota bacterium]